MTNSVKLAADTTFDPLDGEKDKKKIEELKRLLAEEKRASKEAVSKLHRELYRQRQISPANSTSESCDHPVQSTNLNQQHGLLVSKLSLVSSLHHTTRSVELNQT
ncbi:hypothetical protein PoB_002942200 [Plakobranchus ocellatus]|uniref:Uncharacterized protein n=1 Tax=Plakobranchus ocellatus TaxID=259542 RepID=A0AAV4A6M0_9GAST|nr:hypothetical protein PoB_002942200 [Plakobranchus ocellatus]